MNDTTAPEAGIATHQLLQHERHILASLRAWSRGHRTAKPPDDSARFTLGEQVADQVAAAMGSWPFIIIQSTILAGWIVLNVVAWMQHWDPYPFILLNLALSFQAAYAAPFIMMSQNRQATIDRQDAANDYKVNIKAELEIELLHQKIDELRETEVLALTQAVRDLAALVARLGAPHAAPDRD